MTSIKKHHMQTLHSEEELRWHLQNNVQPELTPTTIDRILEDVKAFNEGRMDLEDYVAQGVTLENMFDDLKIELK